MDRRRFVESVFSHCLCCCRLRRHHQKRERWGRGKERRRVRFGFGLGIDQEEEDGQRNEVVGGEQIRCPGSLIFCHDLSHSSLLPLRCHLPRCRHPRHDLPCLSQTHIHHVRVRHDDHVHVHAHLDSHRKVHP